MQDYSWMRKREATPVTEADRKAFNLSRADQAERNAAYWAALGDEEQVRLFTETASRLRREAA